MTDRDTTGPHLWCRVEEEWGRANRVHVMHPNGEILLSFPPDHFLPEVVKKMRAGQVKARLVPAGEGKTTLWLEDESGNCLHSEKAEPASTADPRDGAER